MIAALLALLTLLVVGIPLTLAIDRTLRGTLLLGTAFLIGSGWAAVVLLVLSLLGIAWTPVSVAAATLLPPALLFFTTGGRILQSPAIDLDSEDRQRTSWLTAIATAATLVILIAYAVFSTLAPLWEWDFWSFWGLKARVFYEHGGIDWEFMRRPLNRFANADYPLLLPLLFDFIAVASGAWEDRWIGLLYPLWAGSVLLVVHSFLHRSTRSRLLAALGTLALTGFATSRWVGMGEGPLIAYSAAGLLFLRDGFAAERWDRVRLGAVLLGFAGFSKNEGIALVAATAAALFLTQRGRRFGLVHLWPAAVLPLLWKMLQHLFALQSSYLGVTSSTADRILQRLGNPEEMLVAFLRQYPDRHEAWIVMLIVFAVTVRTWLREETMLMSVAGIQMIIFVAVYFSTSYPVGWHIRNSWNRLGSQVALPLGFVAMLMIAGLIRNHRAGQTEGAIDEQPDTR